MFDIQPITGQPCREPGAAVSHIIIGSPFLNERTETNKIRVEKLLVSSIDESCKIVVTIYMRQKIKLFAILFAIRVARCPVFNQIVQYFGSLSGIKMMVMPENACVSSSMFCATVTGTASVRYFGESLLATLIAIIKKVFVDTKYCNTLS